MVQDIVKNIFTQQTSRTKTSVHFVDHLQALHNAFSSVIVLWKYASYMTMPCRANLCHKTHTTNHNAKSPHTQHYEMNHNHSRILVKQDVARLQLKHGSFPSQYEDPRSSGSFGKMAYACSSLDSAVAPSSFSGGGACSSCKPCTRGRKHSRVRKH